MLTSSKGCGDGTPCFVNLALVKMSSFPSAISRCGFCLIVVVPIKSAKAALPCGRGPRGWFASRAKVQKDVPPVMRQNSLCRPLSKRLITVSRQPQHHRIVRQKAREAPVVSGFLLCDGVATPVRGLHRSS